VQFPPPLPSILWRSGPGRFREFFSVRPESRLPIAVTCFLPPLSFSLRRGVWGGGGGGWGGGGGGGGGVCGWGGLGGFQNLAFFPLFPGITFRLVPTLLPTFESLPRRCLTFRPPPKLASAARFLRNFPPKSPYRFLFRPKPLCGTT